MERAFSVYNLKRIFFPQSLEKSLYFIFLWLSKNVVQYLSSWQYADRLFYKHKTLGSVPGTTKTKLNSLCPNLARQVNDQPCFQTALSQVYLLHLNIVYVPCLFSSRNGMFSIGY